jgi:hypothetical protein
MHRDAEADTLLLGGRDDPGRGLGGDRDPFDAGMLFGRGPNALHLTDPVCSADPADDAAMFAPPRGWTGGRARRPRRRSGRALRPRGRARGAGISGRYQRLRARHLGPRDAVDSVVAFLAFNVTGVYNLPPDFSPEAEAELRATDRAHARRSRPGLRGRARAPDPDRLYPLTG